MKDEVAVQNEADDHQHKAIKGKISVLVLSLH